MDHKVLNFQVIIPILTWEFLLESIYMRANFDILFQSMPREVEHAIRCIIGDGVLRSRAPHPIYQTHVLSISFSNIYDMLREYKTLMKIQETCINPSFMGVAVLDEALSGYLLHG